MNCKSCQDALRGLVAGGSEPSAELRAHLQLCADCKAFFERERSLFAAMDTGLQVSANTALPSSFFPQLRVRINAPRAPFQNPVSVRKVILVAAAAAVLALSVVRLHHRTAGQPAEVTPGGGLQPAAEVLSSPVEPEHPIVDSPLQPRSGVVRAENRRQSTPTKDPATEIIVPAEQEVLLARYAEQLAHRRKVPARMSDDALSAATKPLEVDLIQIAQLDVKPLADRPE
jgi:hypothetical protein